MNTYDQKKNISNLILNVSKEVAEVEGKTRNYGTDQVFYNSEIHTIKVIEEHDGIHVTALAELLNVTKGTVSEVVNKLQKKGVVMKEADPANLSRFRLHLTEKGKMAYDNHEALHIKFESLVEQLLEAESAQTKKDIMTFLERLDNALPYFYE